MWRRHGPSSVSAQCKAEPKRFDCDRGILRRQGRVDNADNKWLKIFQAFEHELPLLRGQAKPREIDAPDQVQSTLDDMRLLRCQLGEPCRARIFDGDDAPGLQFCGGRGRLGGSDEALQGPRRQRVRQICARRAMCQDCRQHLVPGDGGDRRRDSRRRSAPPASSPDRPTGRNPTPLLAPHFLY